MSIEEEKDYSLPITEFQTKYNNMTDYIMAKKQTLKSADVSNISFIFHDKIISETQNYMKKLAQKQQRNKSEDEEFSDKINFYLKNNQNIALYGYGSKSKFIDTFIRKKLMDYPVLVFYGFYATISLKLILMKIEKMINECAKLNNVQIEDTSSIKLKKYDADLKIKAINSNLNNLEIEKIIIVIHNIDGKNLLDDKIQRNLSKIAALQKIQMLVSIDNIRYVSILSTKIITNFDFIFLRFDTFDIYEKELGLEENLIISKQDKKLKALTYIFKSLSSNQKEIIEVIARFILANNDEPGISQKQLFEACFDKMIVTSDILLKENLIEIIDHNVIQEKKIEGGKTIYTMKYPVSILNKIINKEMMDEEDL